MAEKVITKKSFIGGRIVFPGERVDVDEKGEVITAGSTPIGQMNPDQIEAYLRGIQSKSKQEGPKFGDNVADETAENTGEQRLEIANIRPGDGVNPQGLPPGTEPHGDRYVRPAPEGADAVVEVVVGSGSEEVFSADSEFDHDGDGKAGGAPKGGNQPKSRRSARK